MRWWNIAETGRYVDRIESGHPVCGGRRALSERDRLVERLFTGLRLTAGLDLDAIAGDHGVSLLDTFRSELAPFLERQLLVVDGSRLHLTRRGMLVANEVMRVFV